MGLSTLRGQSRVIWKMIGVSVGIHALALFCAASWLTIRPINDRILMVSLQVPPALPATKAFFPVAQMALKHPERNRRIQAIPNVAKSSNRVFNPDSQTDPLRPPRAKKEGAEKHKAPSPRKWPLSGAVRKQKSTTPHKYRNSRLPYLSESLVTKKANTSQLVFNKQVQTNRPSVSPIRLYPMKGNQNKNQALVQLRPVVLGKSKGQIRSRKFSTKTNLGITTNTLPQNVVEVHKSASPTLIRFLSQTPPTYPLISRDRGEEGIVTLRIEILTTGQVGRVNIAKSSGHEMLDHAALKSATTWRFGFNSEKPNQSSWARIPIRFKLAN